MGDASQHSAICSATETRQRTAETKNANEFEQRVHIGTKKEHQPSNDSGTSARCWCVVFSGHSLNLSIVLLCLLLLLFFPHSNFQFHLFDSCHSFHVYVFLFSSFSTSWLLFAGPFVLFTFNVSSAAFVISLRCEFYCFLSRLRLNSLSCFVFQSNAHFHSMAIFSTGEMSVFSLKGWFLCKKSIWFFIDALCMLFSLFSHCRIHLNSIMLVTTKKPSIQFEWEEVIWKRNKHAGGIFHSHQQVKGLISVLQLLLIRDFFSFVASTFSAQYERQLKNCALTIRYWCH